MRKVFDSPSISDPHHVLILSPVKSDWLSLSRPQLHFPTITSTPHILLHVDKSLWTTFLIGRLQQFQDQAFVIGIKSFMIWFFWNFPCCISLQRSHSHICIYLNANLLFICGSTWGVSPPHPFFLNPLFKCLPFFLDLLLFLFSFI